jgi:hypothetical protein
VSRPILIISLAGARSYGHAAFQEAHWSGPEFAFAMRELFVFPRRLSNECKRPAEAVLT